MGISSIVVNADNYYDASAEFNQIVGYIENGNFLEAIRDCENTLTWHTLSSLDINNFNALKEEATIKYNCYINGTQFYQFYYDPVNELKQINDQISKGLYLEAIDNCNKTLSWHTIAPTDQIKLFDLRDDAMEMKMIMSNILIRNLLMVI